MMSGPLDVGSVPNGVRAAQREDDEAAPPPKPGGRGNAVTKMRHDLGCLTVWPVEPTAKWPARATVVYGRGKVHARAATSISVLNPSLSSRYKVLPAAASRAEGQVVRVGIMGLTGTAL